MNKIVFNDDREIIEIVRKKVYGKFKRTTVEVYEFE
jgi:Holliday junction resolvase RusA-like endonuclease